MALAKQIFLGIDIGASRTKVVLLDHHKTLIGHAIEKSGTDFTATAEYCLQSSLEMANIARQEIACGVSTGYGRKNVPFVRETKTEIACQGRGCYFYFPAAITIVDIGGQDNKIIKLDRQGRRSSFKMNRKCAAGTGTFLEEMSFRLDIPLDRMNALARASGDMLELGSYCTVFSATEVLEKIRQGRKVPDIVKGLFSSVIKRILEMDSFEKDVVMTGGVVAHNPYLVEMMAECIGREVRVPDHPQLTGAIGAALYAMDEPKK